jgi:DNA polymerase-3 subunit delta'
MSEAEGTKFIEKSWPIYGHQWAVQLLQRAIENAGEIGVGKVSTLQHAYLLTGPRHIGKTTLAKILAQSLLCEQTAIAPCGMCRSCRLVEHGGHPDFRLIQPVDKTGQVDRIDGTLKVEQASELIREVTLRPIESRFRVFLIQDAHTANDSFANKILKTLEEPPEHVILCLTAEDRSLLLPTIVSRCQVLALRPLGQENVREALNEQWQTPTKQADLLARISNGRLGWAVDNLADDRFLGKRQEELEQLWMLVKADRVERLTFAEKLSTNRDNQRIFGLFELWTVWWRDVLLVQSGCVDSCTNIDQLEELTREAHSIPESIVRHYLQTLQQLEAYLHHTVNVRLALDVLVLKLPRTVVT